MNLELKHLSGYLEYNILTINNDNKEIMQLGGLSGDTAELLQLKGIGTDDEYCRLSSFEEFKPILRPLSDLANEIKHNEKTFYPLCSLLISKYPKWFVNHFDNEKYKHITIDFTGRYAEASTTYQATNSIQLDSTYILNESYSIIQKLLEWHFDVFGLIEKGLAISIHDVE
ncbi:hypothetical protein [Flavobacterium aquiphilum]|uniref:hypothetical protein n=1 Tax=Flavobacterium aquiphilum TaxID=3003261 RepID=UPI0024800458|nr:hypothetical protein [Flavobacterium aquiphilum]